MNAIYSVPMLATLKKIRSKLGIDQSIAWAIANKVFSVVKGPLTVFFIIKFMTVSDQGLWYTFGSLGALTVFAELGFASIISQFVSHDFTKVQYNGSHIHGSQEPVDRFIGFIRFAVQFYFTIVPIAILILWSVGFFYFKTLPVDTYIAWVCFSVVGGLALVLNLFQSIYQGMDKVKQIQVNIFISNLISTVVCWGLLICHLKIWALVASSFTGLAAASYLLFKHAPKFWIQIKNYRVLKKQNFLKETVTLQGKYALSWASGYFIFYLSIPATYKFAGESTAGQLGITFAVITAINGVSASWLSTKIPKLNMLVSTKNFIILNKVFKHSMQITIIIQVILSLLMLATLFILNNYFKHFGMRFLSVRLTGILLITQLVQTIINSLAAYLRSFKEEPFFLLSLLNAGCMAIAVFIVLKHWGFPAFLTVECLILLCVMFPLAIRIFQKFKFKKIEYV